MSTVAMEFENTLDRLNSNEAGSLDLQEKQTLRNVCRASLRGNSKGWGEYFKRKDVKVGNETVSVSDLVRNLRIKENKNNPKRPIITYKGALIGRGSEVAALIQVYAMTSRSMSGLRNYGIDGKIGEETATALFGKNERGQYGTNDKAGVQNMEIKGDIAEKQKIYAEVKRGIDMYGKNIKETLDPLVNRWMIDKHKGKKFTCNPYNKDNPGIVEVCFYGKGGKDGKWQDLYWKKGINGENFLDKNGKFSQGRFLFEMAKAFHGNAYKEYEAGVKSRINKFDKDIEKYRSSAKDNALFEYGIRQCRNILTGISTFEKADSYKDGYYFSKTFDKLKEYIGKHLKKYESYKK